MNNEQQHNTPPPSNPALILAVRRRAMSEKEVNPYKGWTIGFWGNPNVPLASVVSAEPYNPKKQYADKQCLFTPIFNLTAGHTYNFPRLPNGCGEMSDCTRTSGAIYKPDGSIHTDLYRGGGLINMRIAADTSTARVVFMTYNKDKDSFYFYDRTAREYVYKGSAVAEDFIPNY